MKNNFQDYDFIWSSPPCPTHSHVRNVANVGNGQSEHVYPDMKLWQEILFLEQYFEGSYVVENVKPYYDENVEWEIVQPQESSRHYFWSNFSIPEVNIKADRVDNFRTRDSRHGIDLTGYGLDPKERGKVARNMVNPDLGKAILENRRTKQKQITLQ